VALLETVDLPDHTLPTKLRRVLGSKDNVHYSRLTTSQYKELGHMIMCRMTRPSGNLQGAGVTGHTLTRTVSDLMCARRPLVMRTPRLDSHTTGQRSGPRADRQKKAASG